MNDTLRHQVKRATYNPAILGGATGATIGLGANFPAGAIITRILGVQGTTLSGGAGAKLAVYVGTSLGITAHPMAGATFTGVDSLNSTPFKLAAAAELRVFPRVSNITAGSYDLVVEYLLP